MGEVQLSEVLSLISKGNDFYVAIMKSLFLIFLNLFLGLGDSADMLSMQRFGNGDQQRLRSDLCKIGKGLTRRRRSKRGIQSRLVIYKQ